MAIAKVVEYNGSPAISIDGKIYPPMMGTVRTSVDGKRILDEDYYRNLGKSGIKIFFVICDTEWSVPDALEQFKAEAETILRAVPDAYIMIRIGLHPPAKWCDENPDETLSYSDGKKKKAVLYTESVQREYSAMYSLSSQKWREDASRAMIELYDKIEKLPYAERIAGYFFAAGGTSEWYYLTPMEYTDKSSYLDSGGWEQTGDTDYPDVYGDLSPAFRKEFRRYLVHKYKTEENLKKAWNDENVTFENFSIPGCDARYYIYGVDYDIAHPPKMWSTSGKPQAPENGTNIGHFIDMEKHRDVYDFYRALHTGTANSVIHFGRVIKEKSGGNMLTGAFYGSAGSTKFFSFGQCGAVYDILTSDAIDFLASPGVYENRQPGGFTGQRQAADSFSLNNRMFIVEEDARTHHENAYFGNGVEMYTVGDSLNVLKREFGRNLCRDNQAWWFDQHIGGGRYKDEAIYSLFGEQQLIAKEAYEKDRKKISEIAFIYDEESLHVVSEETSHQAVELFRNYEMDRIGAPADSYFHNDMANPKMPDYKLYVFVNTYYLTDEERRVIKAKLSKNNAVALFMYGSGVINPDREKIFSPDNTAELTGIKTAMNYEVVCGKFKFIRDEKTIGAKLDTADIHGDFKRKMWANASHDMTAIKKSRVNLYPELYADDGEAENLAFICETGHPALTLKKGKDFTSVYCASKYLGEDVIRAIAEFAGCHIYVENGDVLYANKSYVTLHSSKSEEKVIKLPGKYSAYEVYEKKYYSEKSDEIKLFMYKGETKMFELK